MALSAFKPVSHTPAALGAITLRFIAIRKYIQYKLNDEKLNKVESMWYRWMQVLKWNTKIQVLNADDE